MDVPGRFVIHDLHTLEFEINTERMIFGIIYLFFFISSFSPQSKFTITIHVNLNLWFDTRTRKKSQHKKNIEYKRDDFFSLLCFSLENYLFILSSLFFAFLAMFLINYSHIIVNICASSIRRSFTTLVIHCFVRCV